MDDSFHRLEILGRGRHDIGLEAAQTLRVDDASRQGERSFTLGLPAAAAVDVSLVANGVRSVSSPGARWQPAGTTGRWRLHDWPAGARTLTVTLRDATGVDDSADLELRFEATTTTEVEVSRLQSRATATIVADVWQGALAELAATLPAGYDVVRVDGPGVADWSVEEAGTSAGTSRAATAGPASLRIRLAAPVRGRFQAQVGLSGPGLETDQSLPAPLLRVTDAAWTRLGSVVRLEGDGILSLVDPGSGREPSTGSGAARRDGLRLEVADPARPPVWSVRWADGTDVLALQVDRLLVDVVVGPPTDESGSARAFYRLWTEVRSSGAGRLELEMDGAARVVAVQRDGVLFRSGRGEGGWVVPLTVDTEPQVVQFDLVVPVRWPDDDGVLELPLPRLNAPAARVDARVSLPAEARSYRLVDTARAGRAGAPPGARGPGDVSTRSAGDLGQQVMSNQAVRVRTAEADAFLEAPVGYHQLTASWSALSATPGPLRIEVEARRPDRDWM